MRFPPQQLLQQIAATAILNVCSTFLLQALFVRLLDPVGIRDCKKACKDKFSAEYCCQSRLFSFLHYDAVVRYFFYSAHRPTDKTLAAQRRQFSANNKIVTSCYGQLTSTTRRNSTLELS